jgi:hypothetical protein
MYIDCFNDHFDVMKNISLHLDPHQIRTLFQAIPCMSPPITCTCRFCSDMMQVVIWLQKAFSNQQEMDLLRLES